jgi:hypothetical protein
MDGKRSERIPRVYARRREEFEWEISLDEDGDEPRAHWTRWDWVSVNHTREGYERVEVWRSWATAMRYCLLWAPNSADDAIWRR